jgi:hypothetical protein
MLFGGGRGNIAAILKNITTSIRVKDDELHGKVPKFVKSFSPESEFEKLCSAVSTATKFLYSTARTPLIRARTFFLRTAACRGSVEGTRAAL